MKWTYSNVFQWGGEREPLTINTSWHNKIFCHDRSVKELRSVFTPDGSFGMHKAWNYEIDGPGSYPLELTL